MTDSKVYTENENFNRFETLINTKEILTTEEKNFCENWDSEESNRVLNFLGENQWLNINVYSEHEHDEFQLKMEQGI